VGACEARGATIVAELVGYGARPTRINHGAGARGSGAQQAMRLAMQSRIRPEESATSTRTGTSTPHGDAAETAAVKAVFGDHARKLIFGSTKS